MHPLWWNGVPRPDRDLRTDEGKSGDSRGNQTRKVDHEIESIAQEGGMLTLKPMQLT